MNAWMHNLTSTTCLSILTFKSLNGASPKYLQQFERIADLPGCMTLHSSSSNRLVVPRVMLTTIRGRCFTAAGTFGTLCRTTLLRRHQFSSSENVSRLSYLKNHILTSPCDCFTSVDLAI